MHRITIITAFLILPAMSAVAGNFDGAPTKGNLSAWRINSDNGQVSLCGFEGNDTAPLCYPWSDGAAHGNYRLLAGDDLLSTWRLNTKSGSVSMCEYADVGKKPHCTPWSQ